MWVGRREFDAHVLKQATEFQKIDRKLDEHDAKQERQHAENQRILWRIMFMLTGGVAFAAWELLSKGLHL